MEYFEVVSIELPYVSGVCTVPDGFDWSQGYHTPITCKEPSDSTWNYYFGTANVPISVLDFEPGHPIYRQIKTITEDTAHLNTDGIASRGSLRVSFNDFEGDPGPVNKTTTGTYFSKFKARNFLDGRLVKLYKFSREDNVNTLVSTSSYVSESLSISSNGTYTLECKSRLEKTYKDYTQFPEPTGARLRTDIDNSTTQIPVIDEEYDWDTLPIIRIGDEFLQSESYDKPNELLTVKTRGSSINGASIVLTRTRADDHSAGDDIQVCEISDDENIADFLERILIPAGVPASYIDKAAYQAEFDDYWSGSRINNVWSEPQSIKDIINTLCNDYMLDIWEDPVEPAKIRVSAVSVWKQPSLVIDVGRGITEGGFTFSDNPDLRSSRAYIYYDKPFKSDNDDRGNFKKLAINKDLTYESSDFYGSKKEIELNPSVLLNTNDASLRTQRHTARFSIIPVSYSWMCEEKYLDYKTGDIVEFTNQDLQDAEGNGKLVRAQVTNITPKYKYNGVGRAYSVKALTYLSAIISGGTGQFTKVVTGATLSEIDIHNDYADRTSTVVDFTLVLDNCTIVSDDNVNPSIRNGAFSSGSTVTIICVNGTDWQSKAGAGGNGASYTFEPEFNPPVIIDRPPANGKNGGICFNADGVDTSIFLEGATGNASFPTANGYLRAPGGGGGGDGGFIGTEFTTVPGDGGGSGAGNIVSVAGSGGRSFMPIGITYGQDGAVGDTNGNGGDNPTGHRGGDGGDWGQNGGDGGGQGGANGGLAGSGIIKSGATVTVQYTDSARFINGNGDTPD